MNVCGMQSPRTQGTLHASTHAADFIEVYAIRQEVHGFLLSSIQVKEAAVAFLGPQPGQLQLQYLHLDLAVRPSTQLLVPVSFPWSSDDDHQSHSGSCLQQFSLPLSPLLSLLQFYKDHCHHSGSPVSHS
ncbi:hypothetical protein E2C01_015825 [Portunus trituberculatus]|uniref:Uncharacterized protein n=1 Tax=Portunus trituberculatus TaxID=210409 RepID=A0A5B7DNZ7_PORTR|nr:hypothetical protein [Portunus trituberculatus]